MYTQKDQLAVNAIRSLSIDAIDKAKSGHPGIAMGAAPMAYVLWSEMNHNPVNPRWFNRDRFILSAGHGSALLYSLIHTFGYDLPMAELKNFRQWGSKTPGHPELGHTVGVDATSGPLGQGIAMSVGLAMAERHMAATYNKDGFNVVDHYTYAICGDGCLQEGVSAEASSLAGHLQLDKLVVLYDSNDITLDGELHKSFSENIGMRYESYGWQYIKVENGEDLEAISKAIAKAKADKTRPSLIEIKTVIGYGSPSKAGKSAAHGSPLGAEESLASKKTWGWSHDEAFHIPEEVYAKTKETAIAGANAENTWNEMIVSYRDAHPELAKQFETAINGELPENWDSELPTFEPGTSLATRSSSGQVMNAIAKTVPSFFGGSADLAGSNMTHLKDKGDFLPGSYEGRNVWYGIREFAMGACLNGIALHGGLRTFGSTFFVFSDYLRPAMRMTALMNLPVTFVYTHDSIAVGEDGPTHEPVEQLASFRAMPNMSVIRPADANESVAAWKIALTSKGTPTIIVLSRQNLEVSNASIKAVHEGVEKGAYVVSPAKGKQVGILIATGSEVGLAIKAQAELAKENIYVSVVSMPSMDRFDAQSAEYKESILPKQITKRLAVEVGSSFGWHKYTTDDGDVLAIDTFGASAPGNLLMEKYGFTVENIVSKFKKI